MLGKDAKVLTQNPHVRIGLEVSGEIRGVVPDVQAPSGREGGPIPQVPHEGHVRWPGERLCKIGLDAAQPTNNKEI